MSAAEDTQAETKEEDPVKKELEAKNREVLDIKVSTPAQGHASN